MYVVLIKTPRLDHPDLGEITRVEVPTRQAAEEVARRVENDGKEALVLFTGSFRLTVGPDGLVSDIQRL
jgi:hypothetical protein